MSSIDVNNAPAADGTQGDQDLGPLAWVLDELRKSLDGAVKAMRRFVRDAEVARESDLAALDAGPLRIARQQLHQACGALEMVGMGPPALVLRSMESAVQKFVQRPETCSDDAAAVIERASFALINTSKPCWRAKPCRLWRCFRNTVMRRPWRVLIVFTPQTCGRWNAVSASLKAGCRCLRCLMVPRRVRGWMLQCCASSSRVI